MGRPWSYGLGVRKVHTSYSQPKRSKIRRRPIGRRLVLRTELYGGRSRARFAWNAHHWPEQGVVLTEFLALRYAGVTCCCAPAVPFRASPGTGCIDASTAPPPAAWG